jgi:hypothetical protein
MQQFVAKLRSFFDNHHKVIYSGMLDNNENRGDQGERRNNN